MAEKFGHAEYEPYEDLHVSAGSFDGGQCVGAHEGYYVQRDSCSYRWQGQHRATSTDKALYGNVGTAFSAPRPEHAARLHENKALARPPGPVQTTEDGKPYQLVEGQPFRTAFAPWKNNPHHLLPDAQLKNGIFEMAQGLPKVQDLVVQGLLKSKYNINHWKNIMILPQLKADGCALTLPTHPQGDSHPAYSARVRAGVDQALLQYQSVVEAVRDGKDHPNPDPKDLVGALEALSDALHAAVVGLRAAIAAKCASSDDISIASFSSAIAKATGV